MEEKIPKVVCLKRKAGVVIQDCDVYIGRKCKMGGWDLPDSKWRNPFSRSFHGELAIPKFREYFLKRKDLIEALPELSGKTLGCWCKRKSTDMCHGDVIVEQFKAKVLTKRKRKSPNM